MFFSTLLFSTHALAFSFDSFFSVFHSAPPKKNHATVNNKKLPPKKEPVRVKVGVYVLNVSKYDLQGASYKMDFYLIFKCVPVCNNMNFEIMNATSSTMRLVTKQPDILIYRIQADLSKTNNLRNYPFDAHALDIIIEDRQLTNDKSIFEPDPSTTALDSKLSVVGFRLLPNVITKITNHYYTVFQRTFSSYKFSIIIERPWLAGILKGILPALIIMCCNFLALFIRIDHISQRLGIATSTLIASVVFHLNLTSSIPPLGYITFADMFMFINYICLLVVLTEVVGAMLFIETHHKDIAMRVNKICTWAIPLFWFTLQCINLFAFNPFDAVSGLEG